MGGFGLNLPETLDQLRALAYRAPATALATNMHLYWTGVASDMVRLGDNSLEWMLKLAADGEVFAAGHAEHGNDLPGFLSTAKAERVDGGYRFTGRKMFGSLTPVWTKLGLWGMDTSDPNAPMMVHAFLDRDTPGYRIEETWDTLGMRATQSHDTILEDVFVPESQVVLICPAGFAGAGLFHLGMFAWALLGFASVYTGIARRAYDMTIESSQKRSSIALTRSLAYHPEVQHEVAEMRMTLEAIEAHVARVTEDWSSGVDYGIEWPVKIISAKHKAVNGAWQVVDTALELSGGSGIFKRNRLEQLFRDARLGRIHPSNSLLAHEVIGKLSLGIDPDEQPRWG
jgi:alkylation response protein AidB-like acyl-CoA dehydrogenase